MTSHTERYLAPLGGELTEIGLSERLATMQAVAGFYPTSKDEINRGMALLHYERHHEGAAEHLQEIFGRQLHKNKQTEEVAAASVRSVTNEFGAYVKKAKADGFQLVQLSQAVSDVHSINHLSSLSRAKGSLLNGTGQLVREQDLKLMADLDSPRELPVDPLRGPLSPIAKQNAHAYDRYTVKNPDIETAGRIAQVLRTIRFHQAPGLIDEAIEGQRNRYKFWIGHVIAAHSFSVARSTSASILANVGAQSR